MANFLCGVTYSIDRAQSGLSSNHVSRLHTQMHNFTNSQGDVYLKAPGTPLNRVAPAIQRYTATTLHSFSSFSIGYQAQQVLGHLSIMG